MLQAAGTKHLWGYINRRQETVAEWVALQPMFKVYAKDTGYEGGGKLSEKWWRQMDAERKIQTMLKEISEEVWQRRR